MDATLDSLPESSDELRPSRWALGGPSGQTRRSFSSRAGGAPLGVLGLAALSYWEPGASLPLMLVCWALGCLVIPAVRKTSVHPGDELASRSVATKGSSKLLASGSWWVAVILGGLAARIAAGILMPAASSWEQAAMTVVLAGLAAGVVFTAGRWGGKVVAATVGVPTAIVALVSVKLVMGHHSGLSMIVKPHWIAIKGGPVVEVAAAFMAFLVGILCTGAFTLDAFSHDAFPPDRIGDIKPSDEQNEDPPEKTASGDLFGMISAGGSVVTNFVWLALLPLCLAIASSPPGSVHSPGSLSEIAAALIRMGGSSSSIGTAVRVLVAIALFGVTVACCIKAKALINVLSSMTSGKEASHQVDGKPLAKPSGVAPLAIGTICAAVALTGPRPWLLAGIAAVFAGTQAYWAAMESDEQVIEKLGAALWFFIAAVCVAAGGPYALATVVLAAASWPLISYIRRALQNEASTFTLLASEVTAGAILAVVATSSVELLASSHPSSVEGILLGLVGTATAAAGFAATIIIPSAITRSDAKIAAAAAEMADITFPLLISERASTQIANPVGEADRLVERMSKIGRGARCDSSSVELAAALSRCARHAAVLARRIGTVQSTPGGVPEQDLEEIINARTNAFLAANRNLQVSQREHRQLLDRTVRIAEDERTRLAAELHDGPIQRLAALGIVMDRSRLRFDRGDTSGASELMDRARNDLTEEISRLRRIMGDLRPPALDQGGLDVALGDLLADWTADTDIESRLEVSGYKNLSQDVETVIFRVVQEGLANIAKHSGASMATVSLASWHNGVLVIIRDNGCGFEVDQRPNRLRQDHFGLMVMQERVELAAGRFEVRSRPRTGTEVLAWLPALPTSEEEGAGQTEPQGQVEASQPQTHRQAEMA